MHLLIHRNKLIGKFIVFLSFFFTIYERLTRFRTFQFLFDNFRSENFLITRLDVALNSSDFVIDCQRAKLSSEWILRN